MKLKFTVIILFSSLLTYSQTLFQDDFEGYVVGQQLACQDSTNWTTWSMTPCDEIEDPMVSDNLYYSGTKSIAIKDGNDLVKELGNQTTGKWDIAFYANIPAGKQGYLSLLSNFSPDSIEWAFECFLNDNGSANLHAGNFISFNYSQDVWNYFQIVVDLNTDSVEFWLNNNLINAWQWTLGANGLGCDLKLAANEFYGILTGTSLMFIDNYELSGSPNSVESEINGYISFKLQQNYPNPFNPVTKIKYSIPSVTLRQAQGDIRVTLKVYDILGREIATLVNEQKPAGEYEVEFNGANLTSGIYFYRLKAGEFIETRKMVLIK